MEANSGGLAAGAHADGVSSVKGVADSRHLECATHLILNDDFKYPDTPEMCMPTYGRLGNSIHLLVLRVQCLISYFYPQNLQVLVHHPVWLCSNWPRLPSARKTMILDVAYITMPCFTPFAGPLPYALVSDE